MRCFVFILMILSAMCCKSQNGIVVSSIEDSNEMFNGIYQSENNDCIIMIKISGSRYEIKTQNLQQTGQLDIKYLNESIFFQFKNLYGEYPKKTITAEFVNNTIILQNYGNAMNEFIRFSEFDSKYIELKKMK